MFKNNCKCGETKFYLQYKGAMVGKYCSGCNKWQRWVGKKDREKYIYNGYLILKEDTNTNSSSNKLTGSSTFKSCTKCNSNNFYLRYRGEMVGKYCSDCDKWSTWVNRLVLKDLLDEGYTIHDESYVNPNVKIETILPDVSSTSNNVVVLDDFSCNKCKSTEYYLKERGNNIGKYCNGCNKWYKWVSKTDAKLLQSKGYEIHPETYISKSNNMNWDNNVSGKDVAMYVDHSDVYVKEYNNSHNISSSLGLDNNISCIDCNTNNGNININSIETNVNKTDVGIKENDTNILKNDTNNVKNEIIISNSKYNLTENDANMFLLEKFISNTPVDCSGCILETKCDMMLVKLCDSIKDAIEFVEDSEVF